MKDENKTKGQLIDELVTMRQQIAELEELRWKNEYLVALHDTVLGVISHLELNDLLEALIDKGGA